ncbi:AP-3 complex subunit beta-2-like isoform X2 [Mytilus trossulus]|uniref:AP-3 complex subunit beta-2-like isoform X2 n=1 Tax=Mytilus trossulus TaxID=6551 RepID=UPI0030067418
MSGGYANEKPPSSTGSAEGDLTADPASSGFFNTDFKRHEDLKTMLDSNRDNQKLEAMKRIVGMVAKGKDASDLFPAVVKNVVCKNLEVKKLVYVYLTRYAEEQQDLALLSISTFQRALKDPNQLIRASALRVLSSIRVPMISPIMMLAIKEAVNDMSPYVRKTAAHGIPKLYSLDPENKEQLVEVIEKLLADKTTLVAGSAIQAFEEVCPERIDLIHKNYRKLCNLLVDVEEWGQVVIVNMLTRYARTQFINPNKTDSSKENKSFYEDSEKEEEEEEEKEKKEPTYIMDTDHRLLLRQAKPLLNSRNSAVVMSVAQLYYHCAPKAEVGTVAKSLIRLLRSHKEVQYIVLSNIATMSIDRKGMFEPFLKSFYIRSSDPTHIKLLKLEILTNLATETNISTILRELQTYVTSNDKEFAAATIQAIGRCASNIAEITDTCLNGLVHLMSNRDESVVAESVVVIKKLLQMQREQEKKPSEHKDIIKHMAKMVDTITVPMARASILWLIGEYSERVPKIAPDVLRKMAKTFINEEDIVKLQIINLAAKLCITNPKQTKLLCQYVFNLAKYDQNYDIRDRCRFLRQMILPGEKPSALAKYAKKIFLATKPAPVLESKFKDREQFQLGTLSHILNTRATGYQELPDWPEVAPDSSVRNIELPSLFDEPTKPKVRDRKKVVKKEKSFYSDDSSSVDETESSEDDDSDEESDDEEESDNEEVDESSDEKSSSSEEEESDEEDSDLDEKLAKFTGKKKEEVKVKRPVESDESLDDDSDDEDSSVEDSDESEEEVKPKSKPQPKKQLKTKEKEISKKKEDLLLDLDDAFGPNGGTSSTGTPGDMLTPSMAGSLSNMSISDKGMSAASSMNFVQPPQIVPKTYELLNKISGNGLCVSYKFTRTISVFSPKMVSIELIFTNNKDDAISAIKIGDKKLQPGMEIQDFPEIDSLGEGATTTAVFSINFNDTTQPAKFDLCTTDQKFNVSITAPVGELLQPHTMSEGEFTSQQGKLGGMNENSGTVKLPENKRDSASICKCVHTVANVIQIPSQSTQLYQFAAQTVASNTLTLITVKQTDDSAKLTVNCEKMVIGSMLFKDLKSIFVKE